jgi:hypothetical protein
MTYGVDQCRVCGKPIPIKSVTAMTDFLVAQRKPAMPEAEWRRRGFLASPTKQQVKFPEMGCCFDCGLKLAHQASRYHLRGIMVIVFMVFATTVISIITLFMRH